MKPTYKIVKAGNDITDRFADRCTSIEVELTAGAGAGDVLKVTLDDRDWKIATPSVGEYIEVYLGYEETGLAKQGTFEISRVAFDWIPKSISIEGSSIGFQSSVKAPAIKEYSNKTLGDIIRDIAKSANVQAVIAPELEAIKIPYRNLLSSPLQLLTELEFEHGAVAKWGDGKLGFTKRDGGVSLSGMSMPVIVLKPSDIAELHVETTTRPSYSKTRMSYVDPEDYIRKFVEAPAPNGGNGDYPPFTIGRTARSKEEAESVAKSQMAYLTRNESQGSIVLSRGDPRIRDQSKILITEARDGVNGSYFADTVRHSYTKDTGLDTSASIRTTGDGSSFIPEAGQ